MNAIVNMKICAPLVYQLGKKMQVRGNNIKNCSKKAAYFKSPVLKNVVDLQSPQVRAVIFLICFSHKRLIRFQLFHHICKQSAGWERRRRTFTSISVR